jgi:hypothetical protein
VTSLRELTAVSRGLCGGPAEFAEGAVGRRGGESKDDAAATWPTSVWNLELEICDLNLGR